MSESDSDSGSNVDAWGLETPWSPVLSSLQSIGAERSVPTMENLELLRSFVDFHNPLLVKMKMMKNGNPDAIQPLISLLCTPNLQKHPNILHLVVKAAKILARRRENRAAFGQTGIAAISKAYSSNYNYSAPNASNDTGEVPLSISIATEACRCFINLCYAEVNIGRIVSEGVVPSFLDCIKRSNIHKNSTPGSLVAATVAAIQSICTQQAGKNVVISRKGVELLVDTLTFENQGKNTIRFALGALANVTSDTTSLPIAAAVGLGPIAVSFAQSRVDHVRVAAAGVLQNIVRSLECRESVRSAGGVEILTKVVFEGPPKAQSAAIGALLVLLDHAVGSDPSSMSRKSLHKLLIDSLFIGAVNDVLGDGHGSAYDDDVDGDNEEDMEMNLQGID